MKKCEGPLADSQPGAMTNKRKHPSLLLALATLWAGPVLAHPGINDHHDVLAAVHDLNHASVSHPFLATSILGLAMAGVVAYRMIKNRRKNQRKQTALMKTQSFRPL